MMKISVVYICVFSLQLRKIKRIHGCIVSSTHKKRFGCFQDKNEEENNNAILKSWMKGGFFGELSIRSTLSKRKRATGLGLSVEVQETQIWVRKCLYRFNNNNTWLQNTLGHYQRAVNQLNFSFLFIWRTLPVSTLESSKLSTLVF